MDRTAFQWEERYIKAVSFAIHLFLTFALGAFIYALHLYADRKFTFFASDRQLILLEVSLVLLVLSMGSGVWAVWRRLTQLKSLLDIERGQVSGEETNSEDLQKRIESYNNEAKGFFVFGLCTFVFGISALSFAIIGL